MVDERGDAALEFDFWSTSPRSYTSSWAGLCFKEIALAKEFASSITNSRNGCLTFCSAGEKVRLCSTRLPKLNYADSEPGFHHVAQYHEIS